MGFKPGLHPLRSVALGESLNSLRDHLSAPLQNGRAIQAHGPRHSETQKLGTRTHLSADATQADTLCVTFTLHTRRCSLEWRCPRCHKGWNIGCLSLKLQNSEFQITSGPRVSDKALWSCPTGTAELLWELNVTTPAGFSTLPGTFHVKKLRHIWL